MKWSRMSLVAKRRLIQALAVVVALVIVFFSTGSPQSNKESSLKEQLQASEKPSQAIASIPPLLDKDAAEAIDTAIKGLGESVEGLASEAPSAAGSEAAVASPAPIVVESEAAVTSPAPSGGESGAAVASPVPSPASSTIPNPAPSAGSKPTASPTPASASAAPSPSPTLAVSVEEEKQLTASLSVSSAVLLDKLDELDEAKQELVPASGLIFASQQVVFEAGDSVFDVLLREMKKNKIHLDFVQTPMHHSAYIKGIGNLYEFDCGDLSGWMFKVNGVFPDYGSSRYLLEDGDVIEWVYSCDLGRDVGKTAKTTKNKQANAAANSVGGGQQ